MIKIATYTFYKYVRNPRHFFFHFHLTHLHLILEATYDNCTDLFYPHHNFIFYIEYVWFGLGWWTSKEHYCTIFLSGILQMELVTPRRRMGFLYTVSLNLNQRTSELKPTSWYYQHVSENMCIFIFIFLALSEEPDIALVNIKSYIDLLKSLEQCPVRRHRVHLYSALLTHSSQLLQKRHQGTIFLVLTCL